MKNPQTAPVQRTNLKTGSQSIQRAIRLLRAVAEQNKEGAKLSKLAAHCGLHIATAHRVLNSLTEEGLLFHESELKTYHLGLDLMFLGDKVSESTIRHRFRVLLNRIATRTKDTVFFMLRQGYEMVCIDRVEGAFPIKALTTNVGSRIPLGLGAGSLAIMATFSDQQVNKIISINQDLYPAVEKITAKDVRDMVTWSRELGYGLRTGPASAVSLPVLDKYRDPFAAVSVAAIENRLEPERRAGVVGIIQEEIDAQGHSLPGSSWLPTENERGLSYE